MSKSMVVRHFHQNGYLTFLLSLHKKCASCSFALPNFAKAYKEPWNFVQMGRRERRIKMGISNRKSKIVDFPLIWICTIHRSLFVWWIAALAKCFLAARVRVIRAYVAVMSWRTVLTTEDVSPGTNGWNSRKRGVFLYYLPVIGKLFNEMTGREIRSHF